MALYEINQEFESQRLQLQQANQWADQAQREKISLCGEFKMRNRLFRANQAKDCQEIEELRRFSWEETNKARQARIDELSMRQQRNPETVNQLLTQIQELQNKVNSLSDAREFYDPEIREQLWSDPRSESTLYCSESQNHASLRFWIAARYTDFTGTSGNVLEHRPAQEGRPIYNLQQFKGFGIVFSGIETWYCRNSKEAGEWNEKRTAEYVNPFTTFPRWRWYVESYWWNLFSQWSDFGIASGKIFWLFGISKLESQFQDWSLFENSISSSHTALDQRSWDGKVNWRTYDIAIDCRANGFPRLRYAWCDDCVCVETTFAKEQVSKSSVLRILTDSYVGDKKCLTWSTSISVQPELMKRYKDSQICSVYVCRMTTSKTSTYDGIKLYYQRAKCLQMWSWKDCTCQKIQDSVQLQTVLALYDQETVRNNGQTSYSRFQTSVKLHIDQMMRTRNFRVRNEVVERGSVTKSQKRKEGLRWEESGRVFSVEGTWTMFQRRLM